MQIVIAYNLKRSDVAAEAEYDISETIVGYKRALRSLGHVVSAVEVSRAGFLSRILDKKPALVFNVAEGRGGRVREAVFPVLYEHVGLHYTHSGPWSLAVTHDKRVAKLLAQTVGVPVAKEIEQTRKPSSLRWIVKPVYEGSSLGISAVQSSREAVMTRARRQRGFPEGLMIEEYIAGQDITVVVLDGQTLAPVRVRSPEGFESYKYKCTVANRQVTNELTTLSQTVATRLQRYCTQLWSLFQLRGVARFDFRLHSTRDVLYFLEVNALPSLAWHRDGWVGETNTAFGLSTTGAGYSYPDVFNKIIEAALR